MFSWSLHVCNVWLDMDRHFSDVMNPGLTNVLEYNIVSVKRQPSPYPQGGAVHQSIMGTTVYVCLLDQTNFPAQIYPEIVGWLGGYYSVNFPPW